MKFCKVRMLGMRGRRVVSKQRTGLTKIPLITHRHRLYCTNAQPTLKSYYHITRELQEAVRKVDRERGDRAWEELQEGGYQDDEIAPLYHLRLLLLSRTTPADRLTEFFSFLASIPVSHQLPLNPTYPILYASNLQLSSPELVDSAYYLCESITSTLPSQPVTLEKKIKGNNTRGEITEKQRGMYGLNVVLGGCAVIKDASRAVETFNAIGGLGMNPNILAYNLLLSAYLRSGLYSAIERTVKEMHKETTLRRDQYTNHLLVQSYISQSLNQPIRTLLYEELKHSKTRIAWRTLILIRQHILSSSSKLSGAKMNEKIALMDINRLLTSFGWSFS